MDKKHKKWLIAANVLAVLMLFSALDYHPYSYYQFLRFIVCGAMGYSAFVFYSHQQEKWTWVTGIVAALFNPIAPFHLDRDTWEVLNVLAALVVIVATVRLHRLSKNV